MLQYLESKLYADVEGTCSGLFGYIIAVVSILDIGKGMVLPGSGQAEFVTRYRAIVFKPFKGEVVDGVVNNVNKVRPYLFFSILPPLTSPQDGFLCGSRPFNSFRLPPSAFLRLQCRNYSTNWLVAHPSGHEVRPQLQPTVFRLR